MSEVSNISKIWTLTVDVVLNVIVIILVIF
jgi:hypothetical protein